MKRVAAILLLCVSIALATGEMALAGPVTTMGITVHAGYSNIWQMEGDGTWNGGGMYGGGIILETMFTNVVGIYSGIVFLNTEYEHPALGTEASFTLNMTTMEFPLCLQLSVNGNDFSVAFLAGITVSQIIASQFSTNDTSVGNMDADALPYLNHTNVGATAGIILKMRITTYTDFYVGCTGTFYFTDLFEKMDGTIAHPWDIRSIVAYVFRTDIFPN